MVTYANKNDEAMTLKKRHKISKASGYNKKIYAIAAGIISLLILGAIWSMSQFSKYERQRDVEKWKLALGIMADERTHNLRNWLNGQFAVLEELAQNGSLQLYTQLMVQRPEENQPNEPAQIDYLRNLIWAAATKSGFMDQGRGPEIGATIAFHARNYIMLFANPDTIITATPGTPEPFPALKKAIKEVLEQGKRLFFNIYLNPENKPLIGFLVPVFALQKDTGKQHPVAVLFGARAAEDTVFSILASKQALTQSDEALLCQRHGSLLQYISPLADGTPALKKHLPLDSEVAAALAIKSPGISGVARDYRGHKVIFTSRAISDTPWVLLQKIDVQEALSESYLHQRLLWGLFFLALILFVCLIAAAWWYGSSTKAHETAKILEEKRLKLEHQARLLEAISNNIRDMILLLDKGTKAIYANKALSELLSIPSEDIEGKGIASLFGPSSASLILELCRSALRSQKVFCKEITLPLASDSRTFYATAVPITLPKSSNKTVLLTLTDITWLKKAEEKKEKLLRALVASLMRSIDLHDPYSANHSANTAVVASEIGKAMGLDQKSQNTLEIAATLCNIGKLSIPKEILTKTGPLTPEEEAEIRKEAIYVESILSGVPFDGPVVDTIVQKNERLDGSGYPKGLKGEQIILTARILGVANAFVAMISPRAYRDALTVKEALNQILEQVDKKFDRKVVAALFYIAENRLDWSTWKKTRKITLKTL